MLILIDVASNGMKGLFIILSLLLSATWLPAQIAVEAWVQRYNHPSVGVNQSNKIRTDSEGNVIVVGYSDESISGKDMLTVKYSCAGAMLWVNRYNGPSNNHDEAQTVAIDGNADVLVAGYSYSGVNSNSSDFVTIKYSSSGIPLWTNRYNGPANDGDFPVAVTTDTNGTVFVTGHSIGIGTGKDYVTVAYASAGTPLWTNRYSNTWADEPVAIATDQSGLVFVSGTSGGEFATIAYSNSGGALWTRRFSATSNSVNFVSGMAVNTNGQVVVAGTCASSGSRADFLTIAYSGIGTPLWTNRFDDLNSEEEVSKAVAVDNAGRVFVTGRIWGGSSSDWVTIACSNQGLPLWTNYFNNGSYDDFAEAISTSKDGKVFVSGRSYISYSGDNYYRTIAYSSAGIPLWTNYSLGPGRSDRVANAVDTNGDFFVTGYANNSSVDFVTIRYSGDGSSLWTNQYAGQGNSFENGEVVVADPNGNIYLAGRSSTNLVTMAYSNDGVPLWTNRFGGPGESSPYPFDIVLNGKGRIVVTGRTFHGIRDYDYLTVAYSTNGLPLWTNFYNGPNDGYDDAYAVAADTNGNVYVTGSSMGVGTAQDFATIAYSSAGVALWTNRYNGTGNSTDVAYDVAVDGAGNVFIAGFPWAAIAYSSVGVPLWTNRYEGGTARAIGVDHTGNVVVTGSSGGDYATISYSNAGVPLWTNRYNGLGNSTDTAWCQTLDVDGNIYVSGESVGNGTSYDYATVKYSREGVPLWTNRYNGPNNSFDHVRAIATGPDGNVFVTGRSVGNGSSNDFATVVYSSNGARLSTNRYNGPANGPDSAESLAVVPGGVVVVGDSDGDFTDGVVPDFAVIKYVLVDRPKITVQPVSRTNTVGSTITFGVTATGTEPLAYQWQRDNTNLINGLNISGASTSTLTVVAVTPADAANYRVVVTNAYGSTTSSNASLTVTGLTVTFGTTLLDAGQFDLAWNSVPGRGYQIQYKTNLNQAQWFDMGNPIVANNHTLSVTSNLIAGEEAYFRIVLLP